MSYEETSAKEATNVEIAFMAVAEKALQKEADVPDNLVTNAPPIRLTESHQERKKCC